MPPKRKRETTPPSVVEAAPSLHPIAGPSSTTTTTTTTPATSDRKGKGKAKQVEQQDPDQVGGARASGSLVHYVLEDGSRDWWKALDLTRDLPSSLRKFAKRFDLPMHQAQNIKLWHVRDEGESVRIMDALDWQMFQSRASNPEAQLSVRIRLPGADASANASATPPLSTPSELQPASAPTIPNPQGTETTAPTTKKVTKPRKAPAAKAKVPDVATSSPAASTTSPTSPEPTAPKAKKQRKTKETEQNSGKTGTASDTAVTGPSASAEATAKTKKTTKAKKTPATSTTASPIPLPTEPTAGHSAPASPSAPVATPSTDEPAKSKTKKEKKAKVVDPPSAPTAAPTPVQAAPAALLSAASPVSASTSASPTKEEQKAEKKRQKAERKLQKARLSEGKGTNTSALVNGQHVASSSRAATPSAESESSSSKARAHKRKRDSLADGTSSEVSAASSTNADVAAPSGVSSSKSSIDPSEGPAARKEWKRTKAQLDRAQQKANKAPASRLNPDAPQSDLDQPTPPSSSKKQPKKHPKADAGTFPSSSPSPLSHGSPAGSAPSTPSPQSQAPRPLMSMMFADKYRPARPSPLAKALAMTDSGSESTSGTPVDSATLERRKQKAARKKQRREEKAKQAAATMAQGSNAVAQVQQTSSVPANTEPKDDSVTPAIERSPAPRRSKKARSSDTQRPQATSSTSAEPVARPTTLQSTASVPRTDLPLASAPEAAPTQGVQVAAAPLPVETNPLVDQSKAASESRETGQPAKPDTAEATTAMAPKAVSADPISIANDPHDEAVLPDDPNGAIESQSGVSAGHPTIDATIPANSEPATQTSPQAKKVVQLSADFDLFRRPRESQHDSSSINGSRKRSSQGIAESDASSGILGGSEDEMESDDEADMPGRPSGTPSTQPDEALTRAEHQPDRIANGTTATTSPPRAPTPPTNSARVRTPVKKAPVGRKAKRSDDVDLVHASDKIADDANGRDQPDNSREATIEVDVAASASASAPNSTSTAKSGTMRYNKGGPSRGKSASVPCIICLKVPDHLQKDCPDVKAGSATLRALLMARQEQQAALNPEDDGSTLVASIEAIEEWLERTDKIANKVEGVKKSEFRPRSPLKIMGSKTGESVDLNAPAPILLTKEKPKGKKAVSPSPPPPTVSATAQGDIEMASPESTNVDLDGPHIDSAQPSPSAPDTPETPLSEQDAPYYPPIHLRAMQKARRPGSHSGLSVLDAIIETEPSDESSSDDDDIDQGENGSEQEIDGAETDEDGSSTPLSSSSVISSDSDSDQSVASATSRVPLPTNPSLAMSFSLTRELSAREKKKARLSAAKMHPVAFDDVSASDNEEDEADIDEPSPPPSPVRPRQSQIRAASESSIGDYDDGMSRESSIDSTIETPYQSQAPPVIASSLPPPVQSPSPTPDADARRAASTQTSPRGSSTVSHTSATQMQPDHAGSRRSRSASSTQPASQSQTQTQSTRSTRSGRFQAIAEDAESNAGVDESPGAQAVLQGIAEEETSPLAFTQELSLPNGREPVATQTLSQSTPRKGARTAQQNSPIDSPRAQRAASASSSAQSTASFRSAGSASPPPSTHGQDVEQAPATPRQGVSKSPITRTSHPEPSQRSQPESMPLHTQTSPTRGLGLNGDGLEDASPLFMTQGSQIPATQAYETHPQTLGRHGPASSSQLDLADQDDTVPATNDSSPPPSPSSSSSVSIGVPSEPGVDQSEPVAEAQLGSPKLRSPTPPSDDDEEEEDEDEDDAWVPARRPTPPPSTQTTPSIYPSLSSLSADLLRGSLGFFGGSRTETPARPSASASQPARMGNGHQRHPHLATAAGDDASDDSSSGSDSSDDETKNMSSAMKSRFASGGLSKRKSASQPISW